MQLRFVDHTLSAPANADERTREVYSRARSLPEGMPVILDNRWRPVEPWLTYFRIVTASTAQSTVRNYAYDALRFASFLDARGTDVVHASDDDIVAYRDSRVSSAERPVSPATWQREVVVIRGIYQLLLQTGQIRREPWITIGRSSALRSPWRMERLP
ncbi:unnamed protein product [Penicillium discolor]